MRYLRFSVLIICVLLGSFYGHSQNEEDKKQVKYEIADSLYTLARSYTRTEGDTCFMYCTELSKLGKKHNVPIYQAWALSLSAQGHLWRSEYDKVLEECDELLKLGKSINRPDQMINAKTLVGLVHERKGEYDKAAEAHMNVMELADSVNEPRALGDAHVNLGNVYFYTKRFKEGLEHMEIAAEIYEKADAPELTAVTQINIGNMVWELESIDSAITWYHIAYNYFKNSNDMVNHGLVTNSIALAHANLGVMDSAIYWIEKSIEIKERMQDLEGLSLAYNNKGLMLKLNGDLKSAEEYYLKSEEIGKQIKSNPAIAAAYQELAPLYADMGDFSKAYKYQKLYADLKDTILNEKNNKVVSEMEAKYKNEKKTLEIDKLKIDKKRKEAALRASSAEKKRKDQQIIAIGAGLALMLIIAVVALKANRDKKKANKVILEQKEDLQETHMQLRQHHREIADSIMYAKRIQEAIMPSMQAMDTALKDGFVLYLPKDVVAGDFFWMEQVGSVTYFAAADCTGHGVPGAMVSMVCSNALSKALLEEGNVDPGKLLDRTREIVVQRFSKSGEEVKDGMDISLCALNKENRQLRWAGANNPIWILRKDAEEIEEIKPNKQPIGLYQAPTSFTTHTIELAKGDTIYVFTDGYQDQFGGPKGKKFKAKQLKEMILTHRSMSMDDQLSLLQNKFLEWKGEIEQLDDVCVIGVKV